ncbi:MAG: signal peptidase I [Dehalococcoidia bacterium]
MTKALREFAEAVLLALGIFFLLQLSIQNFRVEGASMQPTLEEGQYLLVNKLVYRQMDLARLSRLVPFWEAEEPDSWFPFHPPRRGEVIVFHFPGDPRRDFVKRVIGLPGEHIRISRGKVYINGEVLEEPYLLSRSHENLRAITLSPDQYFVMGDNRTSSNDSRDWGPVPLENVIGRAWITYWPASRLGFFQLGLYPMAP